MIVPVKTGATGGFQLEAFDGQNGGLEVDGEDRLLLAAEQLDPEYSPALTPGNRLYFAGRAARVYYTRPDAPRPALGQIAFYGQLRHRTRPPTTVPSSSTRR